MNKINIALFAFFFNFFGLTIAYAELPDMNIECHGVRSTYNFGYCVHQVKGSVSKDVLYYLHGVGSSEYEWQNNAALAKIYETWGANAPAVITISYGSFWLLSEKSEDTRGLFEHFIGNAMPWAEKVLKFTPEKRMLSGASMGGFNASQLYLKQPTMFTKVAMLCPAITSVSPYASKADVDAYIERTHATRSYVNRAIYLSQMYYPTEAAWAKADPVANANQVVNNTFPAALITIGNQDEYGFQEGAKALADAITAKGGSAQWSLVEGKHCTFDVPAAISFLTQ